MRIDDATKQNQHKGHKAAIDSHLSILIRRLRKAQREKRSPAPPGGTWASIVTIIGLLCFSPVSAALKERFLSLRSIARFHPKQPDDSTPNPMRVADIGVTHAHMYTLNQSMNYVSRVVGVEDLAGGWTLC